MNRILVSTSSFGKEDSTSLKFLQKHGEVILNPYGRQLTTDEFISLANGCNGVVAGTERITADAMSYLPELKVISRCGTGVDNVCSEGIEKCGIKLYNTPNAPVDAVAEFTVSLMLNLLRHVNYLDSQMKSGIWSKTHGNMLSGKNVAIIGLGRIGQRVAALLTAFNINLKYFDSGNIDSNKFPYKRADSFEDIIKWADIITLHCSSVEHHIINKNTLCLMKKNVLLINTARGSLIDEGELYKALSTKAIAGAALDVFENEPYTGSLTGLSNVIVTPHVASGAIESRINMEMEAAKNCLRGLGVEI